MLAEHYNHDTRSYWKVIHDGSLCDDDEDPEYDCANCSVERECDEDCSYHNEHPTWRCRDCSVEDADRAACHDLHEGEDEFCAEHNEFPNYDCDDCNTSRYCDEDCSYHCEPTRSSYGTFGVEIVSPPLQGVGGLEQTWQILQALSELQTNCDESCGLHIHHDASDLTIFNMQRLAKLYLKYEHILDAILPETRRNGANCHARPLRTSSHDVPSNASMQTWFEHIDRADHADTLARCWYDRYVTLNFQAYSLHGTVEFRHHHGTLDFWETLYWLVTNQRFIDKARRQIEIVPTMVRENVDLSDMLRAITAPDELKQYWQARLQENRYRDAILEAQRAEAERQRLEAQAAYEARVAAQRYERQVRAREERLMDAWRQRDRPEDFIRPYSRRFTLPPSVAAAINISTAHSRAARTLDDLEQQLSVYDGPADQRYHIGEAQYTLRALFHDDNGTVSHAARPYIERLQAMINAHNIADTQLRPELRAAFEGEPPF